MDKRIRLFLMAYEFDFSNLIDKATQSNLVVFVYSIVGAIGGIGRVLVFGVTGELTIKKSLREIGLILVAMVIGAIAGNLIENTGFSDYSYAIAMLSGISSINIIRAASNLTVVDLIHFIKRS